MSTQRLNKDELLGELLRRGKGAAVIYDLIIDGKLGTGTEVRDALREILPDQWQRSESPGIEQTAWLKLFRAAGGYVSDTNERLDGVLTIYRGAGSPRHARG